MKPKVHILHAQAFKLVRTLMIKFVKSKLLIEEKEKNPKSVNYWLLINAKDLKNCKYLRMVEVDTKANNCFVESLEITNEEKEILLSCPQCYQVSTA